MTFRRGAGHFLEQDKKRSSGKFEPALLPEAEKERLCRSLLAEFGITHIREGGRGELIHACLLPFKNHRDQDKNPTASLNYQKLTYKCLGCGAGGGLLWLIGIVRDTSGEMARKWLADQTGMGPDEQSLSSLLQYFDAVYNPEDRNDIPMPKMDPSVLDPWMLIHPYMTEHRGVPESTIIKFKVGYGVIRVRDIHEGFTESHRIIIPHFWKDSLVGWQSRRLIDDGTPKYLSSPDFPKDRTLFNYHAKDKRTVIVESPMSVLSKAHMGLIEATFGASVTDRQLRLISMHPSVTLFMDNDEAGWTATKHLGDFLMSYSMVWVADNPFAADPADMDDETYQKAVDNAVPYALWKPPTELIPWEEVTHAA